MSTILGINAYHGDSAACLVVNGKLVAASEEERFRRIKHWAGLPTEAIRFCLGEGNVKLGDIDHIAINRNPKVNNWRRVAHVIKQRPDIRLMLDRVKNIRKATNVMDALAKAFPDDKIRAEFHPIEHHLAHAASAFLVSPFNEAVSVSIDGFGDFASASWGMGRGSHIELDQRIYFPHSLGIFYSALTQFIGFTHFGDEYKVMGLAPYGQPKFLKEMREIVRVKSDGTYELNLKFFRHHKENVAYSWNDCSPEVGRLYTKRLEELLGPSRTKDEPLEQKHKDIARSIQAMYEEAFFALLNSLHAKYKCNNLALSGGCAMNSVANGKVYLNTPFKRMYIPASAGDAGGAIGGAYVVWHELQPGAKRFHMLHAYTGPDASSSEIKTLLAKEKTALQSEDCTVEQLTDPGELCRRTAQAISEGKVIGWFQGKMEWGPRALGNRSILGDPRRADMKDILNKKIKRRESFRPFAPSVLRDAVTEWFEQEDDVPFMMEVFQIRAEKRSQIPAVTHADGSGRLQTVSKESNPLYYRLISEFRNLSGVPMVLNTSFNENEPVVCKPEEALSCFLRTKMDVLVMGNHLVQRTG